MKKLLKAIGIILLIPIILCVGLFAFFAIEVSVPDDFNYVVNDDQNTCTILSAKNMNTLYLIVPEEIDGYTVTKIASRAFEGHKCFEVILPKTIEYIGEGAFAYCENLFAVEGIEKCTNLKEIQQQTFRVCIHLSDISLPEGLEKIGDFAFLGCYSLESINIPSTVTTIEPGAFSWCEQLTKITIPASVELIGVYLFEGCIALESIEVEEENANYRSVDGVLYTKEWKHYVYIQATKQVKSTRFLMV